VVRGAGCGVQVAAETSLSLLTLERESFGELLPLVQHSLARELANRRWILENRNKVTLPDLDEVRLIGVGTFGQVTLNIHRPTGKPYALKTLGKHGVVERQQVGHVRSEMALLSTCSHPFLNKLAAAFQDNSSLFFILEFIQGGELFKYLQEQPDGTLPLPTVRFYAACVAAALGYLNSLNIVYRDIKPENLLLSSDGYLKVIDFGFAKVLELGKTFTFCGTPDYMAPEVVTQRGYALKCDWWSLGVLVYEMILGLPPFVADEDDPMGELTFGVLLDFVQGRRRLSMPSELHMVTQDFLTKLIEPSEKRRLGAIGAMAHPFFKSIGWMELEKGLLPPPYMPPLIGATDASHFDEVFEEPDTRSPQDLTIKLPRHSVFGGFVTVSEDEAKPGKSAAAPEPAAATSPAEVALEVEPQKYPAVLDVAAAAPPPKGAGCCTLQ